MGHLTDNEGNTLGVYLPLPSFGFIVPLNPDMSDDWSGMVHPKAEYVFRWDELLGRKSWHSIEKEVN